MKILIDGYNLIFEVGLPGKRINAQSLAKARTKLLTTIQRAFADDEHEAITVVFDARREMLGGQTESANCGNIQVRFAVNYPDADTLIEELIRQHSSPKQLLVVSSDHRIHKAALRRKASPMDSGDWYDRLIQMENNPADPMGPPLNSDSKPRFLLSNSEIEMFQAEIDDPKTKKRSRWDGP